jgi:hypothetical protein
MFAKKARPLNFNRGLGLRRSAMAARPCNDNQPITAVTARMRPPTLLCHWLKSPTGCLECRWTSDTADLIEGISRLDHDRAPAAIAILAA